MNSHSDISTELGCVLLAAGGSSRLGQPKQLIRYQGRPLVQQRVETIREAGIDSIVVVTGREHKKILKILNKMEIQIVRNDNWVEGMGTSLALGVQQLPASLSAILVLLCDQWRVDSGDLKRLIESWHSDISMILASEWPESGENCFGPPVIFPKWAFSELSGLRDGEKARKIIRNHPRRVSRISIANARWDLDTPDDLEELRSFEDKTTLSASR